MYNNEFKDMNRVMIPETAVIALNAEDSMMTNMTCALLNVSEEITELFQAFRKYGYITLGDRFKDL